MKAAGGHESDPPGLARGQQRQAPKAAHLESLEGWQGALFGDRAREGREREVAV
jgi:hypothetical protein